MPQHPDPLLDDDSNYASSEDPDFAPDAATQAPISDSSGSESETEGNSIDARRTKEHARKGRAKSGRRKREKDEGAKDLGFENSGDEEVVETGLKKRRKRSKKDDRVDDDESDGGNGGFVRTRRMAALA
jgi:type II secretory pathway component HofQ